MSNGDSFDLLRASVMVCALTSLVLICGYFVVVAFGAGSSAGMRSVAGILLPFVVGGFVVVFRRSLFERVAEIPPVLAFAAALAFGVGVMLLIENLEAFRQAPIAELIVATGLSLFTYAPGAVIASDRSKAQKDVWMAYYFGTVGGMLGYVVLLGLPFGD